MTATGYPGAPRSLAAPTNAPQTGETIEPPPDTGAFASAEDLEARWHALTTEEKAKASALLDDAADLIRTTCPAWRKATSVTLKRVSCAAVKRAMLAGDDTAGVTQHTETAGSYSESYAYSNPAGDLYLTASEKEAQGGTGAAWSSDLADGSVS